jgi:hypothetical protein
VSPAAWRLPPTAARSPSPVDVVVTNNIFTMHAQGATDPSCAVRVASVTLRKISRFVARFACPCVFRFTRLRLFVKQRSHASSVAALTTAFTHQIVPMCIMSSSFLSPRRLYCCRAHALLLLIIPADTEPNAELLLPDAPVAASSAPVGEEFNSQKPERACALATSPHVRS